jgi:hypothetical protein
MGGALCVAEPPASPERRRRHHKTKHHTNRDVLMPGPDDKINGDASTSTVEIREGEDGHPFRLRGTHHERCRCLQELVRDYRNHSDSSSPCTDDAGRTSDGDVGPPDVEAPNEDADVDDDDASRPLMPHREHFIAKTKTAAAAAASAAAASSAYDMDNTGVSQRWYAAPCAFAPTQHTYPIPRPPSRTTAISPRQTNSNPARTVRSPFAASPLPSSTV